MTSDRLPMEICSALGAGRGSVSVEVAADTRVGAEADNMQHIAGYFAVGDTLDLLLSIYLYCTSKNEMKIINRFLHSTHATTLGKGSRY